MSFIAIFHPPEISIRQNLKIQQIVCTGFALITDSLVGQWIATRLFQDSIVFPYVPLIISVTIAGLKLYNNFGTAIARK
jgi:hypothetical protein